MYAETMLHEADVPKMTLCVTFGALQMGAHFRNFGALSEYVTFYAISAIAVREMIMCVTFAVHHFGCPAAP